MTVTNCFPIDFMHDFSIHDGGDYKDDDKCHLDAEPPMSCETIPQKAVDALVPVQALYQVGT